MSAESSEKNQKLNQLTQAFVHEKLRYQSNALTKVYSYEQVDGSEFDVERWRLGLPPFGRWVKGKEQTKKVVITDRSISVWRDCEIARAQIAFKKMLQRGVKLHVMIEEGEKVVPVPLTREDIHSLYRLKEKLRRTTKRITALPHVIATADSKLGLTQSNVYALNYNELQSLLHGREYNPADRLFYSAHHNAYYDGVLKFEEKLTHFILNHYPNLSIDHEYFTAQHDHITAYESIDIHNDPRDRISVMGLAPLLTANLKSIGLIADEIQNISSYITAIQSADSLNLLELLFWNKIATAEEISNLLSSRAMRGLVSLNLDIANIPTHLGSCALLDLKIFKLGFARCNANDDLSPLLRTMPNIEELALKAKASLSFPQIHLASNTLLNLKKLTVKGTVKDLDNLLSAAPNAEEIQIEIPPGKEVSISANLKQNSLPHLKKLTVKGAIKNLDTLLSAAPNVEEIQIEIPHTESISIGTDLKLNSLPHLKKLSAKGNINGLDNLINATSNLEELELDKIQTKNLPIDWKPNPQPNLKKLHVSYSAVNGLDNLINAAPNLEEIDIRFLTPIRGAFKPNFMPHLNLKKLCAKGDINGLGNLINTAPNLEEIDINNTSLASDEKFNVKPYSLLSLKILHLSLLDGELGTWITAAPYLEKIHADWYQYDYSSSKKFDLPPDSLLNLKTLYLHETANLDVIHAWINAAPHLKKIIVDRFAYHLTSQQITEIQQRYPKIHFGIKSFEEKPPNSDSDADIPEPPQPAHTMARGNQQAWGGEEWEYEFDGQAAAEDIDAADWGEDANEDWGDEAAGEENGGWGNAELEETEETKETPTVQPPSATPHTTPVDPPYDVARYRDLHPDHTPTSDALGEDNRTKNQGALIKQLCQYLTLYGTAESQQHIEKIKKGICHALSRYFLSMPAADWERRIDAAVDWNGEDPPDANLVQFFERLYRYILQYQSIVPRSTRTQYHYLGDALPDFLSAMKNGEHCVLGNPWHAIAIRKVSHTTWHIYDPNFPDGYKEKEIHASSKLVSIIHRAIGPCVDVALPISTTLPSTPLIQSLDLFIQQGGLLHLNSVSNSNQLLSEISAFQRQAPTFVLSDAALEGLLLRNTSYVPAWLVGLKNPATHTLTLHLLQQWISRHPTAAEKDLLKSIEHMAEDERAEQTTFISSLFAACMPEIDVEEKHPTSASMQIPAQPTALEIEEKQDLWLRQYNRAKQRFEKKPIVFVADDLESYTTHCLTPSPDATSQLIECGSTQQLEGLRFALQKKARDHHQPFVYIHSADELMLFVHKAQRGELTDFSRSHPNVPPVLVIRCSDLSAYDMQYLARLTTQDHSSAQPLLPPNTQIIGLFNRADSKQKVERFYPYFQQSESFPEDIEEAEWLEHIPKLPNEKNVDAAEVAVLLPIDLFQSADWKKYLLGEWTINATGVFEFKPGALSEVKSGMHVDIQNGPWHDEEFQRFWKNFSADHQQCTYAGHAFDLTDVTFSQSAGYDWKALRSFLIPPIASHELQADGEQHKTEIHTLTSHHFKTFLGGLSCTAEGFCMVEGFIKTCANAFENPIHRILNVHLTETLTEDQWARLLTHCKNSDVKLHLSCAPGITLPKSLQSPSSSELSDNDADSELSDDDAEEKQPDDNELPLQTINPFAHTQVIASTDPDVTITDFKLIEGCQWEVIDISECSASDLLERTEKSKQQEEEKNEEKTAYRLKIGALLKLLEEDRHILLTGKISPVLEQQLAPLLLQRLSDPQAKGKLWIITPHEEKKPLRFQYLPAIIEPHIVQPAKKETCLMAYETKLTGTAETKWGAEEKTSLTEQLAPFFAEPLHMLKTRLHYLHTHPGCSVYDTEKAWEGLEDLPLGTQAIDPFDPTEPDAAIQAKAQAFHAHRRAQVDHASKHKEDNRPLFVSGLSGTGKTTYFTEKYKAPHDQLFMGMHAMRAWAIAKPTVVAAGEKPPYVFLFLDESTLLDSDLSVFESLFNDPPGILVNGEYHTLTSQHRVILAGNPACYSDDRRVADFLRRHPNILIFGPLPPCVLYWDVLKPLFENTHLENQAKPISKIALDVYRFLVKKSKTDVLISPRELEMMVLLTIANTQPGDSQSAIFEKAKYFAYSLAKPLVPVADQAEFEQQFKPKTLPAADPTIPPSRQSICQKLDEYLALRQWRRAQRQIPLNEGQRHGGLGGITIETDLVEETQKLVLTRLQQAGLNASELYQTDATCAQTEVEKTWGCAANEGAVLISSHANSTASLEQKTNAYLTGRTADGETRCEEAGFFAVKIQTSAALQEGLNADSTATQRREYRESLPTPTEAEMQQMVHNKGLSPVESHALFKGFIDVTGFATSNDLFLPTPKDLLQVADETVYLNRQAASHQSTSPSLLKISQGTQLLYGTTFSHPAASHVSVSSHQAVAIPQQVETHSQVART